MDADLLKLLTGLKNSELNHLLLEVFREKTKGINPATLLSNYQKNRFTGLVDLDPMIIRRREIDLLALVEERGFDVVDFSQAAPLGTSSVLAPVDQMHVVSALRNVEIASDITNLMALEAAVKRRAGRSGQINQAGAMQLIRGQLFDVPGWTPYFRVLALTSAELDRGNHQTELAAIQLHAGAYYVLLTDVFDLPASTLQLQVNVPIADERQGAQIARLLEVTLPFERKVITRHPASNNYYPSLTFGIQLEDQGKMFDLVDGGFVPWTSELLQNRKERFLISGLGTEYLTRLLLHKTV